MDRGHLGGWREEERDEESLGEPKLFFGLFHFIYDVWLLMGNLNDKTIKYFVLLPIGLENFNPNSKINYGWGRRAQESLDLGH